MKNFDDLTEWSPKKLRKLRMNLNNRIESFKNSGKPAELQKSHILYSLELGECENLLERVKAAERNLARSQDD